jgi:hypothetical protein
MMKDNKVTVPVSAELDREIELRLDYGASKSEWVRETIRMRLNEFDEISEEAAGPQPIINRKDISTVMEDNLHDRLVDQLEYGEGGRHDSHARQSGCELKTKTQIRRLGRQSLNATTQRQAQTEASFRRRI